MSACLKKIQTDISLMCGTSLEMKCPIKVAVFKFSGEPCTTLI
jgi:hypothetical protein